MPLTHRHALGLVACLLILLPLSSRAVTRVFTGVSNGNNNWNTAGNCSPSGAPVTDDTVFITNNLGAGVTSTSVLNTGDAVRAIVVDNARLLQVRAPSIIGSNTILNLGSNSTGSSVLSNNHLFLDENGVLTLRQSTLIVAGLFSNSANSLLGLDLAGGRILRRRRRR